MKNTFLILALALLSAQAYSQSKNSLSLVYGAASDNVFDIGIGGPGYSSEGGQIYGLNYTRQIKGIFSIETGLEYSVNNLLWDYEDARAPDFTPQKASVKMLSVPVYANFTFLKYLFANAGITADFETSHQSDEIVANQSGIGLGLGIGGKYNFNRMTLFINPFIQTHAVIAFRSGGGGSLADQGVKFGIGYRF